jgi:hypothetical protein
MRTISLWAGVVVGVGACSPSPNSGPGTRSPGTPQAPAETVAFYADERKILGILGASDARIAARTGIQPSADEAGKAVLGAILAEDPTAALESDRTDLFSFDVRARSLAQARKALAPYAHPIPDPHPNDGAKPELERQLLLRLVDEEDARLAEERDLPRSGVPLVRGLAATWSAPRTPAELEKKDAWFASRVDGLRAALAPRTLPPAEIAELEDALDPLERVAFDGTPYPKAHAAFTELRIALGALAAGPPRDPKNEREAFVRALRVHLGVTLSPETLARIFETTAAVIAKDAAGLVGAAPTSSRVEDEARALLLPRSCAFRAPSILRKTPPPERAYACTLAARAEKAKTAAELAAVLASAHDALTVGSWALWMLAGADAVKPATEHARLLADAAPELVARLERRASTNPLAAVADALVAEWLYRNGMTGAPLRATAWMTFGDAPFDLLERDLNPHAVVPQKPPVVKVTETPIPAGSYTAIPVTPLK